MGLDGVFNYNNTQDASYPEYLEGFQPLNEIIQPFTGEKIQVKKPSTQVFVPGQAQGVETLPPEAKSSVQFLQTSLNQAQNNFQNQQDKDGWIANTWNAGKEIGNAQTARSNVRQALANESKSVENLQKALDGELLRFDAIAGMEVPVSFEQAFKTERGVNFSEIKIQLFNQKTKIMANIEACKSISDEVHKELDDALSFSENNSNYGASQDALKAGDNQLETAVLTTLKKLYNGDMKKVKAHLESQGLYLSKTELGGYEITGDFEGSTSFAVQNIAKDLLQATDKAFSQALHGKPYNTYQKEYEDAYKKAYGNRNVKELTQAYMESQEKGVEYIKTGGTFAAMIVAIACPALASVGAMSAGAAGTAATVSAGLAASQPFDILEKSTDSDGLTKDEAIEYGQTVAQNSMWMAAGLGASQIGNFAKETAMIKGLSSTSSKAIGYFVEGSIDATTQYAIMGENGLTESVAINTAFMIGGGRLNSIKPQKTIVEANKTKTVEINAPKTEAPSIIKLNAKEKELFNKNFEKTKEKLNNTENTSIKNDKDNIIPLINEENIELVDKMINMKNKDNTYTFNANDIEEIASITTKENRKYLEAMLNNSNLNGTTIISTLQDINANPEKSFAEIMAKYDKPMLALPQASGKTIAQQRRFSLKVEDKAAQNFEEVKNDINKMIPSDIKGKIYSRVKRSQSTATKLFNRSAQNKDYTFDSAMKIMDDAVGSRIVLNDLSEIDRVVEGMAQSIMNGGPKMLEIRNYRGPNGKPYLTDDHIQMLQDAALSRGYKIQVLDAKKEVKHAGYTTAQFKLQHNNGLVSELQIRGNKINEFAEIEHYAFDARNGKPLGEGFEEFTKAAKALTKEEYKEYEKYLAANYDYYRSLEQGLSAVEPAFPKNFNPILKKESLIELYNNSHKEKPSIAL